MWSAAEMIEAFDARIGRLTELTDDDQKVSWWNQGAARFHKPLVVDVTWLAGAREVALPEDFIALDKLTVDEGVTPQPWRVFGLNLVTDQPEGATEDGGARVYYWGDFAPMTNSVGPPWWADALGYWPLDDASGDLRNLGLTPDPFDVDFYGGEQLVYETPDSLGNAKALDFNNPANAYPSADPATDPNRSAARIQGYPTTFQARAPFSAVFRTIVQPATLGANGEADGMRGILGHLTSTGDSNRGWGIWLRYDGRVILERCDNLGGLDQAGSTPDITDGDWHVIVCVYDGDVMTVYVDGAAGVPAASVRNCGGSTSYLQLGIQERDFAVSPVEAYYRDPLDDVAIFDYALTAEEVESISAQPPNVIDGEAVGTDSEMTTAQDHAALNFALARFYRRLSTNRFFYKRYATLLGEDAASARSMSDEADRYYQDFLDSQEDAHLDLTSPAYFYES